MNRRAFIKLGGASAVAGGAGGLMVCAAEPYRLVRRKRRIELSKALPRAIRILHVSDLHIGNRQQLEFAEKALMQGLHRKPDLICMTGDFINRKLYCLPGCRALFRRLAARVPVFACLGNHDGGRWVGRIGGYADPAQVANLLAESGVRVLRNENIILQIIGQPLSLVGLDDLWSGTMDIIKSFSGIAGAEKIPRLVLSHNPDTKQWLKKHPWDLMLCGHTHGGQVYIPGIGRPVLPVEDRRFIQGLYRWERRQIHISSGVGTSCGVRFHCPPEICLLEIKGTV